MTQIFSMLSQWMGDRVVINKPLEHGLFRSFGNNKSRKMRLHIFFHIRCRIICTIEVATKIISFTLLFTKEKEKHKDLVVPIILSVHKI